MKHNLLKTAHYSLQTKNLKGFTLIETLIYLALFAIVIGGGMAATYYIIEGTNAVQNKIIVQEEANFLLHKIDWALTGATAITAPTAGNSGTTLQLAKSMSGTPTQLIFIVSGSSITLKEGGGSAAQLNSSNVSVSALSFEHPSIISGQPDAITASFTLASAQNGRTDTENFSTTKYLRK